MADKPVALIVGGGSGIGADSAKKLSEDGFDVAVMSSSGKGEALGKELGGFGFTGSNLVVEDLKEFVDREINDLIFNIIDLTPDEIDLLNNLYERLNLRQGSVSVIRGNKPVE